MKKILISSILAGMMCATMATAEVFATVDGQKITEKDMDFFKQVIPGFSYDKLSKQDKEAVINQLIERKLALIAATKDKIEKDKEYKEALSILKTNLAIDLWIKQQQEKFSKSIKVTQEDAKKFYDSNKNLFIDQQAQVRQIVVKTKEEADKILADLKGKKGDALQKLFIDLANKYSIDAGTQKSQNGGDLGTVNRNQMLPQFTEAVFGLAPQTYTTTPIQTEAGYHIVFLQSKTEAKTVPFDQAESAIQNNLKAQMVEMKIRETMKQMREKAKVKIEPIK
ncbi:peptidylprolyl isomerase [Helicobacter brantae]|nr:peptidyl-prolyl cis-trans isomerase [Helicobacter brantae]